MSTLSAAAKKSLKTVGAFRCKAPSIPYRVVAIDELALMAQNRLYLMAMVRALNTGDCFKDVNGKVTTRLCSWVHAERASSENIPGTVAKIYMVGIDGPVALVVKGEERRQDVVDFTSNCSDALGFYVMPKK